MYSLSIFLKSKMYLSIHPRVNQGQRLMLYSCWLPFIADHCIPSMCFQSVTNQNHNLLTVRDKDSLDFSGAICYNENMFFQGWHYDRVGNAAICNAGMPYQCQFTSWLRHFCSNSLLQHRENRGR